MSEKRKRDTLPTKPPSIFTHMVGWGAVSGYFLAWGFLVLFGRVAFGSELPMLDIVWSLFGGFFLWGIFGALPGMVMGALLAGYMRGRLIQRIGLHGFSGITEDYAPDAVQLRPRERWTIFAIEFALMLLPASLPAMLTWQLETAFISGMILLVPSLIAGGAASYAAQRYLERLRGWKAVNQVAIEKAKHSPIPDRLSTDKTQDNGIQYDVIAHTRQQRDQR